MVSNLVSGVIGAVITAIGAFVLDRRRAKQHVDERYLQAATEFISAHVDAVDWATIEEGLSDTTRRTAEIMLFASPRTQEACIRWLRAARAVLHAKRANLEPGDDLFAEYEAAGAHFLMAVRRDLRIPLARRERG
jgi:hypothetical protein